MFDPELAAFKQIDLRAYAAGHGYVLDNKGSWKGSAVMRHPGGDKIVIKRDIDGHYVYFSVRRDDDNGTIIDFAQRRLGVSIGAVRKELRPWIGGGMAAARLATYSPLPKTSKDLVAVEREYSRMQDALRHLYLEGERGIPSELLGSDRFVGRIQVDQRGNAVFPHFDVDGALTGFEKKNRGFTGFSGGGIKGLWLSQVRNDDKRFILCEGAVDALSHAVLFPDEHARYASIGGKPNPVQPELIRAAAARMLSGSEIVAAMDADADGRKLARVAQDAVELTGRADLRFRTDEPPAGFKDWNDVLKAHRKPSLAPCRQATARPA